MADSPSNDLRTIALADRGVAALNPLTKSSCLPSSNAPVIVVDRVILDTIAVSIDDNWPANVVLSLPRVKFLKSRMRVPPVVSTIIKSPSPIVSIS